MPPIFDFGAALQGPVTTSSNANFYNVSIDQAYGLDSTAFQTLYAALGNVIYGNYVTTAPAQTPEQREAWVKAEAERAAKINAATKRAENLMFSILKPEQVRQYQDTGYFETEIDDRVYRIHKRSHSANVELIVGGKPIAKYCVHPSNCYSTPVQDTMISQLLKLHSDEAGFLKTANKTVLYG